jgi:selenocysteine-specific elongation factor
MSDIAQRQAGIVIGTAGHIDHGKTALVRALTGIDTDRLVEEKKRGISIDLGFAHLALPNGMQVAFVDVPGHERFIKNMLAGIGGIDAVLLVVAADEGIMPQTREHFDICRLLGIRRGSVALTKVDLVDDDLLVACTQEVRNLCAGSFLEGCDIVPVSAYTGQGLPELKDSLGKVAGSGASRAAQGIARLPIDRSFTMQGFGTVVTGTLWSGILNSGDTVEVHPRAQQLRVRGLQVHGKPVSQARAGQRTAVNLAGVEAHQLSRGFVVAQKDAFDGTTLFDCAVDWLEPKHAQRSRQSLHLFIGTSDVMADVRLLGSRGANGTFTRVSVREPLIVLPGDRFVFRTGSATVGGGGVVDPFPPVRLNRAATLGRMRTLEPGDPDVRLDLLVTEGTQGRKVSNLVRATGWTPDEVLRRAGKSARLIIAEAAQRIVARSWVEQKQQQILSWLAEFHTKHTSLEGAPLHQLRNATMSGFDVSLTELLLKGLPQLVVSGETVALKSHHAKLLPEDLRFRERVEQMYRSSGFQPPSYADAIAALKPDTARARTALEALIKEKRLVRVSQEFVFHVEVVTHIRKSLAAHKGRSFTVPEFKEWIQISRKHAIPLLEFLDREHVTRRDGDRRIVL